MNLLQMSISGAVLILLIALIRLAALRAVPKRTFLFLWALVLIRLLIPFPALFRVPLPIPETRTAAAAAPADPALPALAVTAQPRDPRPVQTASPGGSGEPAPQATRAPAVTPAPAVPAAAQGTAAGEAGETRTDAPLSPRMAAFGKAALWIWLAGLCITAAVFAALYVLSYRRFRRSSPVKSPEAEAWLKAHPLRRKLRLRTLPGLTSPLTYGILRPVILLPEGLDPASEETAFALEHEYIHVRRLDALWKLLPAAAAAVHWFNPFVWLMWFLANRDLELSCDEEVLRRQGTDRRGDYARALLAMEEKRGLLPPLHAGFGAGTTKERILSIMKYKKKTVLSVALAAVLVAALAACALGGRGGKEPASPEERGAPGADLTVGPVRWGMSRREVLEALTGTKGDGDAVGADGKITMAAEFCACPVEISWCFADDGNGPFLNGIEVLFTDEEAFDRETVAKALEESWGQRCKYVRARKYSPGVDGPDIAPKEDWYWRTEDFSDEYQWKSGVTARFTTAEAVYTMWEYMGGGSPEPAGAPLLRIDATGRNQAEGRLKALPKTEETRWEVYRLMGLATLLRPSAASWQYYDPTNMRPEPGAETASIRIHTPGDLALAEKLFAPYAAWLTLDYRGDQYRELDVSGYILDGSLTPAAEVFAREDIYDDGITAVFTNRTDKTLTLFLPMEILAERSGTWVVPERTDEGMLDWISPTLAPGESYTLFCDYATSHARYDFVPGRYMLTVWTQDMETRNRAVYGAVIELADGPVPAAGETTIPFTSGGYTLNVPAEYADKLTVETETKSEYWETLFSVTEKASYEAGQKLSPGNEAGLGWLFGIARVSEEELGKMLQWDMSGVRCFAREETGDYLLLLQPTDVRFVPTDASPTWQEQWTALNDWAYGPMTERFLADNESLTPCRHGDGYAENALARVLYYDPAEYGEAAPALIQCGVLEAVDPLGTEAAREYARKILWGFASQEAVTAADFPTEGLAVTVRDPMGIELTFRKGSDVVAVANVSTDIRYFRMAPVTPESQGHVVGDWACGWYFDAAAVLSGETVTYKNGNYTLRLPAEYAGQLYVYIPGEEGPLFQVFERSTLESTGYFGLTHHIESTDGWIFSIWRQDPDSWGRWVVSSGGGAAAFARDGAGDYYVYNYPIWETYGPGDVDREGEGYLRWRVLMAGLRQTDITGDFIRDNGLTGDRFTEVQERLCFAAYGLGYDFTVRRDGGESYELKASELSDGLLKKLLWETDYGEEAAVPDAGAILLPDAVVLSSSGGWSLVFQPGSELILLQDGAGCRSCLGRWGDTPAGDLALELYLALELQNTVQPGFLPERSVRTVSYVNRGVTLSIPEEYAPYLIVETPEGGDPSFDTVFRVLQRASWENGQKQHPGEDRGDGLLFILRRMNEEELLWELRAHPTPTEYVAKDGEGGYYLIAYPSDVRYVPDRDVIDGGSEGWQEWEAWCAWSQGLAAEGAFTGPGLTSFHKSFSELESALAAFLSGMDEYCELRFLDEDGRELDPAAAPEGEAIARQILTECSSYDASGSPIGGDGQFIRLVFHLPTLDKQPVTVTFREGSTVFEETVDYGRGQVVSKCVRVSFSGAGQTVGDLMAKWFRQAAEAAQP